MSSPERPRVRSVSLIRRLPRGAGGAATAVLLPAAARGVSICCPWRAWACRRSLGGRGAPSWTISTCWPLHRRTWGTAAGLRSGLLGRPADTAAGQARAGHMKTPASAQLQPPVATTALGPAPTGSTRTPSTPSRTRARWRPAETARGALARMPQELDTAAERARAGRRRAADGGGAPRLGFNAPGAGGRCHPTG